MKLILRIAVFSLLLSLFSQSTSAIELISPDHCLRWLDSSAMSRATLHIQKYERATQYTFLVRPGSDKDTLYVNIMVYGYSENEPAGSISCVITPLKG